MRIGVCIPCYAPHIPVLYSCLQSIEKQSRKPEYVSISISSCKEDPTLDTTKFSFPVVYKYTKDTQCASKNRNVAADAIYSQVDILSFFDADDVMHPRRLELLENHFIESKLDSCVHNTIQGTRVQADSLETILWPSISNIVHLSNFKIGRDSVCGRVWWVGNPPNNELGTSGHCSVKSSIWNTVKYKEAYGMGEDSEYVWQVVTSGAKHGFLPDVLSFYVK